MHMHLYFSVNCAQNDNSEDQTSDPRRRNSYAFEFLTAEEYVQVLKSHREILAFSLCEQLPV